MRRGLQLWSCVRAAYAFLPKAYARAWGAIGLAALPMAAPFLLGDPRETGAPTIAALVAFMVITGLVRDGALYRLGVTDGALQARAMGLGPAGLQFGKPELRLAGAGLLVALFLALIFVAGFVVSVFVASAAGLGEVDWTTVRTPDDALALAEPWKLAMAAVPPLGLSLILLILIVQLSLYAPATVARGRMVSLDALALSEGQVLKLLAGFVLVYLPTIALIAARQAAQPAVGATAWLGAEIVVGGLVQAPLTAGFLSTAYRGLEYVNAEDRGG